MNRVDESVEFDLWESDEGSVLEFPGDDGTPITVVLSEEAEAIFLLGREHHAARTR